MSRTAKDLKSHKKGFGKYKFGKPKRRLTPLLLLANKITGKKQDLVWIDNDMKQDNFKEHWNNAKRIRALRRQLVAERQQEKSSARSRVKRHLNFLLWEAWYQSLINKNIEQT